MRLTASAAAHAAAAGRSTRVAHVAAVVVRSTWLWAVLVAIFTFGTFVYLPATGLDVSWQGWMYTAAHLGLHYGSHVVFTFGPYGFLVAPVTFYATLAKLAFLFAVAVHLAWCLTMLWAARRVFPLWLAVLLAFAFGKLVAIPSQTIEGLTTLAFVWIVALLVDDVQAATGGTRHFSPRMRTAILATGIAVSSLIMMVKLNVGGGMLALWILLAFAERRPWRTVATLAGSAIGSFLVLWVVAGQRIGDIPSYLARSYAIASGYSAAQGWEHTKLARDLGLALVVALIVFGCAGYLTRSWPLRHRIVLFAATALVLFPAFKDSFVSHDSFHAYTYFLIGAGSVFALMWNPARRWIVLAATLALLAIAFDLAPTHRGTFSLAWSWHRLSTGVTATLGSGISSDAAAAPAALRGAYAVDPKLLALLRGHKVASWPTETNLTYAYKDLLTPDQLPVFQSNVTYTPSLDTIDADYLASTSAPDRILRHVGGVIEGRRPTFETPRTDLAMLCNYVDLAASGGYEVVGRVPNRCGKPASIGSVSAHVGDTVVVPPAPSTDDLVYARIDGLGLTLPERIETLLYKAERRKLLVDGGGPYPLTTNALPGTVGGPLLMHVPRRSDFPGTLALGADAATIAALDDAAPHGRLTYTFYAMPIAAATLAKRHS